jgi:hypothetical protein
MRIIYLIIILLIIILTISIFGYLHIDKTSEDINQLLVDLESNIKQNNWARSRETKDRLAVSWAKTRFFYSMIIDHANYHDLDTTLTRIFTLINLEEKQELLPELAVARKLNSLIPEEEKLALRNIF